jgi:hypothetical protein
MFIPSFGIYKIGGSGSGSPVNTIYSADDTIAAARNVGLSTLPLTFGTSIFSMQGANGRVGVGTANAFTGQVTYASDSAFASYFVVRTASDRYGLNHNNGTVELASYITSTASSFGTTTNHPLQFYTNDSLRGAVLANGNFSFGTTSDLSARVGIRGIDATDANFALKVQNSVGTDMLTVRNDNYTYFGAQFFQVNAGAGQIGTNTAAGLNGAHFTIFEGTSDAIQFDIVGSGFNNIQRVRNQGTSGTFSTSWDGLIGFGQSAGLYGIQIASNANGTGHTSLTFDTQEGEIASDQIQSRLDTYTLGSSAFLKQNFIGGTDRWVLIDSIKGDGFPKPYIELKTATNDGTTSTGISRLSSISDTYFAVEGGSSPISLKVGIGTSSPTSKLQVVGLPTYADNAAALAGGLTAGAMYIRTGHGLDIVV